MVIRLSHMPGEEPVKKRGNKFGAKRTPCHQGHTHASGSEAKWCNNYTLLERGGQIRHLEQQPKYFFVATDGRRALKDNGQPIRYTADFRFEERDKAGNWHPVVIDVKGHYRDDTWLLRRAFFRFFHPDIDLREVS